jgi:DNA-binding NarL/FixJ family response regulator
VNDNQVRALPEGRKMPERRRILIADDHPLMRSALAQAVSRALPDVELLEAANLDEVIAAIRAQPPDAVVDLVLLDLHMPGTNGFTGLFLIRAEFPAVAVIVISASEDPVTVGRALDYGASGFVPKSAPSRHLAEAIRTVLDGDLWFPEHLEPAGRGEDISLGARLATLTPQQLKVFAMLAEGRLNKQIAHQMRVTEATVKAHVTMILRKLGVGNRTQAVAAAGRLLVDQSPPVTEPVAAPAAPRGSVTPAARQV